MKIFKRRPKDEPSKEEQRKEKVERARRQHEIEEERRQRLRPLRRDIGPFTL